MTPNPDPVLALPLWVDADMRYHNDNPEGEVYIFGNDEEPEPDKNLYATCESMEVAVEIAHRVNVHDALVEALELACHEIQVHRGASVCPLPMSEGMVKQLGIALALARKEER